MKYLGVKIDETLSGKDIIDTILKKCNSRIKFLYRQARCFPTALKKTLCQSLVQSHVDYGISSWYAAMSQKAKTKLQIIQNKMVRLIVDLGPRTHITTKHMADLNIPKIPGRVQQLRFNITHKIYYNQAPTYLQTNFSKNNDRGQHTRGSYGNFVVPNVKGAEGNTFYCSAIKDWNKLPIELKTCENIASFKKRVKKHLLQKVTEEADKDFYSFESAVTRVGKNHDFFQKNKKNRLI